MQQSTMSGVTAVVLGLFVGYAGAWYLGLVEGNFALLLFMATVVTGVYWVAERLVFLPQRRRAADDEGGNGGTGAQTDQTIGGLTMWIPAALVEVIGLMVALGTLMRLSAKGRLRKADRDALARARHARPIGRAHASE